MPLIIDAVISCLCLIACAIILHRIFRCIHAWELVDKTELPSGVENMAKAGVEGGWVWPSDIPQMAKRTVIIAMRCPKCGAAKLYKESA